MNHLLPVSQNERIHAIDTLRGVALLGILLINIVGMGLPDPAYFDPSLSGGSVGLNLYVFIFNNVFIEGAMRGLFSLLFGAGIILFVNQKEEQGQFTEVVVVWFRRLLWLIPIGMFHAYVLLWPGDILFAYGLIGLLLFPFRKLKPLKLIGLSLVIILIGAWLNVQDAHTAKKEQKQYFEAVAMIHQGKKLPYDTMIGYYNWMEKYAIMKPTQDVLQPRIANYHKGYKKAFQENKPYAKFFESEYHYRHNYIDILSMMLLGMALFKLRILHAEKSKWFYIMMMVMASD